MQIDPSHFGGISEARKLAAWAEAYYMLVAPHNVCGPVATAACLHLDACTPNFKIQEHFNDFVDGWVKEAVTGYPESTGRLFQPAPGPPASASRYARISSPSTPARRPP